MKEFDFKTFAELLEGTWKGEGIGVFPTINNFEYIEHLRFESDEERALMYYEQRTWIKPTSNSKKRSSHWESGFISFVNQENIFMNNVHENGRVESLLLEKVENDIEGYRLEFSSSFIKNDERMLCSGRTWYINPLNSTLQYEMDMSTLETKKYQLHLKCNLIKEGR